VSPSRRQFISSYSSWGLLAATNLGSFRDQADPVGKLDLDVDPHVVDFWEKQVRQPYEDYLKRVVSKGAHLPAPEEPIFLMLNANDDLQLANTTSADSLPDTGSPDVLLSVRHFHPSESDKVQLQNYGTGSLRIDFKQVTNQPGIPDALAWSAMSSILAGSNKQLPDFPKLDFNPGVAWGKFQTINVPDGIGFWTWNFFVKRREGVWGNLLSAIHKSQLYVPLLGLPAVAVVALTAVDKILAFIQGEGTSKFLFQSQDTPVVATKKSLEQAKGSVILPPGSHTFVAVRGRDVSKIKNLTVKQDLLVPKGTKDLDAFDAASQTAKDVSYITLSVNTTIKTNTKKTTTKKS
jgi:hypothetical protein